MSITFKVDDVDIAAAPCALITTERALAGLLEDPKFIGESGIRAGPPLAWGGPPRVVGQHRTHSLLGAVHSAFSEHRPLMLTPDAVWITLSQGFAAHVNAHAETLRARFVRHEGKLRLNSVGSATTANDWHRNARAFCSQIAEHVGAGLHRVLVSDFTTTGPDDRMASEIMMMAAFQSYFEYSVCICGIPSVTLAGSPEDWRTIRRRVDVIAEFGLEHWAAVLRPICDELVKTAEGTPDVGFWQSIYKPKVVAGQYAGGSYVTGWVSRLFPYLECADSLRPNPAVPDSPVPHASWSSPRVEFAQFPSGLSRVRVELDGAGEKSHRMALLGGFVGISQDEETLALSPAVGWALVPDQSELGREEAPQRWWPLLLPRLVEAPGEGEGRAERTLPEAFYGMHGDLPSTLQVDGTTLSRVDTLDLADDQSRALHRFAVQEARDLYYPRLTATYPDGTSLEDSGVAYEGGQATWVLTGLVPHKDLVLFTRIDYAHGDYELAVSVNQENAGLSIVSSRDRRCRWRNWPFMIAGALVAGEELTITQVPVLAGREAVLFKVWAYQAL